MPSILIIECSTPRATVALVDAEEVQQRAFTSDRNHNAMLFEPLGQLLAGRRDIERVLVGTGPGSYSGTRVGIAAAQGIGLAFGCPVVGVPSILAVPAAESGASCLAIGDARRGSYWTAAIHANELGREPQLCDADSLIRAISSAATCNTPIFAFEQAAQFPVEELQSLIRLEYPIASLLWKAWQNSSPQQRTAWQAEVAQPIYLKPPHITPGKREKLI